MLKPQSMTHFTHWWKWTSFTESNPKTLKSDEIDDINLWRVEPNTKKLEYRDLPGPEKLRVIQNINFQALLPNFEDHKKLEKIWNDFMEIIGDLKLDLPTDEPIAALTAKIKSWFQQFLSLYQAKDVTPYMHALYHHIPEFLKLYINVAHFKQQGMEKYNEIAS